MEGYSFSRDEARPLLRPNFFAPSSAASASTSPLRDTLVRILQPAKLRAPHDRVRWSPVSMNDAQLILVTAGILKDGDRILICQRHRSDRYGLQWEFPGGKVHAGEDLQAALRRELAEELTIEAEIGEEVFRLRYRYPDRFVEVVFLAVPSYRGKVENRIFEAVEWVPRQALPLYDFLEADRELVNRIARGEIV